MDLREFVQQHYPGSQVAGTWFSYFSTIVLIETLGGERLLVKSVVPETLETAADPEGLAATLNENTRVFREGLVRKGVVLAPRYELYVEGGKAFHVSAYCGIDAWTLANSRQSEPALARNLARVILACISGVLSQDQQEPEVGCDGRLSNFAVVLNRGKVVGVVYVDTFPPLVRIGNQYYVHFPNPQAEAEIQSELDRKFRRFGILRRLGYDFLAVGPVWEAIFVAEATRRLGPKVASFFSGLPDRKIFEAPLSEALERLERLGPDDKDTLRCLAARVLPMDSRRRDNIQAVFSLSRKDPSDGFSGTHEERVEHLKRWLAELLAWRR